MKFGDTSMSRRAARDRMYSRGERASDKCLVFLTINTVRRVISPSSDSSSNKNSLHLLTLLSRSSSTIEPRGQVVLKMSMRRQTKGMVYLLDDGISGSANTSHRESREVALEEVFGEALYLAREGGREEQCLPQVVAGHRVGTSALSGFRIRLGHPPYSSQHASFLKP